jgi:PTH1 family peptidyl-tRNA hydrolase
MVRKKNTFDLFKFFKKDPAANVSNPFLLAGLGNPGKKFRKNRHNVGYMLISHLAEHLGENFSRMENKALIAKATYDEQRIILAKPQTFMNLSGQSIGPLARYYKVSLERVLVAFDDVDLPLGTIRIRPSGGSSGQKGMKSIIDNLGTTEFPRLRLGIGRPPGRMSAANYVLQDFPPGELDIISSTLDRATEAVLLYIASSLEEAMNRFNS